MLAYLVAQVRVDDLEAYKQYAVRSPAIIAKYGGRVLARGGTVEILEGVTSRGRVVIIEFPSMEAARNFYYSPEYQQAKQIRLPVADAQFLIVEGVG
jgi:uncharacterized protein (DUF1330 family)